jgi:DNA end-binding protein Ku
MARQPYWKGYLKLSLVTCPVVMAPAVTESGKVTFKMVNGDTGHPVESVYLDSETGKPVPQNQQVKGYERGEGEYVLLEDEDFAKVALESTRTIDIETFVPVSSIAWIWFDTPHYLLPGDKVGLEAFSVIREAMKKSGMVGISQLVLQRREHAVLVEPRGKGLVLWTLRYGAEVRPETEYFAGLPDKASADAKLEAAIGKKLSKWTEDWVEDPLQGALLALIASKKKAKSRKQTMSKAKTKPEEETESNVVSLADALRRSLQKRQRPKH